MNLTQRGLVRGALKSGVAAVTSVIITNLVDVPHPIFSLPWFRHVLIACFFFLLLTEARYWNQWANSPDVPVSVPVKLLSEAKP